MTTSCTDKVLGVEIMDKALVKIQESIAKSQGNLNIKMRVSLACSIGFLENVLTETFFSSAESG